MSGQVGPVEIGVGVAVVLLAAAALLAPRRMASVVSFLVFGIVLSVLWALSGAPDVALAEAAIGTGVTGVLFVETVTRSRVGQQHPPQQEARRSGGLAGAIVTVVVALGLAAALAPALWLAARPVDGAAPGLARPVQEALPRTGVEHGVTGVLLNLRSYDTLLEIAVLLVAVLAVLVVVGTSPAPMEPSGTSRSRDRRTGSRAAYLELAPPPLQGAATSVLVPVLVLLAGWLLFAGTTQPGGAFQAGAVIAGLILLLHLAARPALPPGRTRSLVLAAVGLLAFVGVAAVGPVAGAPALALDPSWAGTVIVVLEILLAVSIGASLAVIALAIRAGEVPR